MGARPDPSPRLKLVLGVNHTDACLHPSRVRNKDDRNAPGHKCTDFFIPQSRGYNLH